MGSNLGALKFLDSQELLNKAILYLQRKEGSHG